MIVGLEDFSLVSLAGYGGMIEDFVSYPANAKAASGMPYRSLEELDRFLYPELSVLDPAWLTESVREIEWFRVNGVFGGRVSKTPVRGLKPPPVVTKDFLEEARETIRRWSTAWENGGAVSNVIVDPDRLPKTWTPLGGGITITWDGEGTSGGSDIPGIDMSTFVLPEYININLTRELRSVLARAAVRDFLSIRLFDGRRPDDNPTFPSFSWTSVDGEGVSKGVDRHLLARQILAVHSDCEKATTFLLPSPQVSVTRRGGGTTYSVRTSMFQQDANGPRIRVYSDCSTGCGTIVPNPFAGVYSAFSMREEKTYGMSINSIYRLDRSLLFGPDALKPSVFLPVKISGERRYTEISYEISYCYNGGGCDNFILRADRGLWKERADAGSNTSLIGSGGGDIYLDMVVPDWVIPRRAWLLVVARSRRHVYTDIRRSIIRQDGTSHAFYETRGYFKSQLYVCAIPAQVTDDAHLHVSVTRNVPSPSGSDYTYEARLPAGHVPDRSVAIDEYTRTGDNSYAEIVGAVGLVVEAKFTASVKG